jgi:HlyD family secretion protein
MKKTIITLIVIAAIAGSVGAYYYTRPGPEPKVSTVQVNRGDVTEVVSATGTLDAVTAVLVGSQVGGIIQELGENGVNVDFNSFVEKGQVLLKINPDAINTQIESAQATVVQRRADLESRKVSVEDANVKANRVEELFKRSLSTQADLDTARVSVKSAEASVRSSEASLGQAEASLNQQKVNLANTIIRSPINGIIINRQVDVGQTVQASYQSPTLFIVAADLTKMKCTANIDESEVSKIRTGQIVRLRIDAYPTETFTGKVIQVRLQPVVVQNVVTYGTVIDVPNLEYKLKPGMTANVSIEINKRTDVVRVPNTAIRFRPTAEIFEAFNQEVPPELQPRGTQGAPGGSRMAGGQTGQGGARAGQGVPGAAGAPTAGAPAAGGQVTGAAPQARAGSEAARPSQRGGGDATPPGTTPQFGANRQGVPGQSQGQRGEGADRQGMGGGQQFARGEGGQGAQGMGGARGGGRGFDPNDPEAVKRMLERYQAMPADQKAQYATRMKERGIDLDALAKGAKPGTASPGSAAAASPATGTATTIDALFGPLPPRVSQGRAYIWDPIAKKLKSVRLRLGVSDGQYSELLEGEIPANAELVTAVTLGTESANRNAQSSNPLMQQQRGGMMGGPPGGGGGRGGGGR